jgi:signal transduction histidine kinase/HPt (histidine-containing phosphotransfer) domain-containing protein/ActR/RegA family two-component response regulator
MKDGKRGVKKILLVLQNHKNFASVLFIVSTAMVLLISVNSNMVMNQTITMLEEATQQRLLNAAIAASLYVSAEELDRYHTPEDIRVPEYEELRERLIRFAEKFSVLYVYYWRDYGDGRIQYIVDNDVDSETQMTPANFFELNEAAQKTLSGEMSFTRLAEYTPTWDGLLSAFAPVYDKAGNLYCIAGVDISDEIILIQRDDTNLLNTIRIVALLVSIITTGFSMHLYSMAVRKSRLASEAKSSFLANMSHEIRTPMNAILGMAELMLRKDLAPDVYDNALNIKQAGASLLSIINDILDFSKIESGKLDIVNVEYQFASVINDVIAIIRMRLNEKPVCFITRIDGSLPAVLIGDEVRVRQVLLNLLTNAVKYTREGSIVLSIHEADSSGGQEKAGHDDKKPRILIAFEVADTGIGIKKEDMEKLFGNFTQVDKEQNRGVEGTGLGLAISRDLCHLMGGDITVESVYGQGSVFTALIPQYIKDDTPFALVEKPETKTVLVYENRSHYTDSVVYTLDNLGVGCTAARTRNDFAEQLTRGGWQFIFTSSSLFDEVREILQKSMPGAETEPVLVVLMEYGQTARPDIHTVFMPVQPVAVANILNGKKNNKGYHEVESPGVRFTAPDARILIVDDIETNLKVAEGLLSPYKMSIDRATGGLEAVQLVQQNFYDLVLMDHMMPGMDGTEAAAAIRAWEEAQNRKRVPIIALTANAISGMKEMFLEKGFNDYISKPIEIAKLDDMMARWIPGEKQIKSGTGIKREAYSGKTGIQIPGVDTQKGINMTGGTEAGYRKVLAQFCKDAAERLPIFARPPAETAFAVHAHAIKSAAGTIGAAEIAKEAAALEAAGNAGDKAAIEEGLPKFREDLAQLIEGIEKALEEKGGGITAKGGAAQSAGVSPSALQLSLQALFSALRSALEIKNMREIDKLLEEIEQLPLDTETREQINAVSDQVLMGEYGKAMEIVNMLLTVKES